MLQKVKDFCSKLWAGINAVLTTVSSKVIALLAIVVGVLLYYINLKHKEIAALKAQVDLTQTHKEADLLESQVQEKLAQNGLLQKQIDGYNEVLSQLEEKRKTLPEGDRQDSPEDYWKKN